MILRKYKSSDSKELAKLFYNTIHTINIKDYTKEQLNVWTTGNIDLEKWDNSFKENYTIVAIHNDIIVGFGDIDKKGYLDRLFVHKDYQSKGIASKICNELEKTNNKITTHSSITAKSFFEKRGYKVIKEQQVERQGILLKNFIMEKEKLKKK